MDSAVIRDEGLCTFTGAEINEALIQQFIH